MAKKFTDMFPKDLYIDRYTNSYDQYAVDKIIDTLEDDIEGTDWIGAPNRLFEYLEQMCILGSDDFGLLSGNRFNSTQEAKEAVIRDGFDRIECVLAVMGDCEAYTFIGRCIAENEWYKLDSEIAYYTAINILYDMRDDIEEWLNSVEEEADEEEEEDECEENDE